MQTHAVSIRQWSPEDKPREKLVLKGKSALSDAELIALLLGAGTRSVNSIELGRQILLLADNNLHQLARLSIRDLLKIKGIGEVKAMTIVAALELGRRRKDLEQDQKHKVSRSHDAYDLLKSDLMDLQHEEFWVILLNRANRVIRKCLISQGGVAGTVADPKIIFKAAIDDLACGIILAHNHPSGNLAASHADIDLTKKLATAGKMLEIQVLDHIIIAGQKYFSFADEGLM